MTWIQLAQCTVKYYTLLNTKSGIICRFHKTVGAFHYWLRHYKLLKKDSVPWSWLNKSSVSSLYREKANCALLSTQQVYVWSEQLSRYCNGLHGRGIGDSRFFSSRRRPDPLWGSHSLLLNWYRRLFPRRGSVTLIIHHHLEQSLGICGSISPFHQTPVAWRLIN